MLFIEQLYDMGLLDTEAVERSPRTIQTAIARYHQYLDVGTVVENIGILVTGVGICSLSRTIAA